MRLLIMFATVLICSCEGGRENIDSGLMQELYASGKTAALEREMKDYTVQEQTVFFEVASNYYLDKYDETKESDYLVVLERLSDSYVEAGQYSLDSVYGRRAAAYKNLSRHLMGERENWGGVCKVLLIENTCSCQEQVIYEGIDWVGSTSTYARNKMSWRLSEIAELECDAQDHSFDLVSSILGYELGISGAEAAVVDTVNTELSSNQPNAIKVLCKLKHSYVLYDESRLAQIERRTGFSCDK